MIVVKIIGGLGNQMFQVAFAKALSMEYNEKIYLDTSVYQHYKIRDFSAFHLSISNSFNYIEDAKLTFTNKLFLKVSQKAYRAYQKIVRELIKDDRFGERPFQLLTKKGLYYNFDRFFYHLPENNSSVKCIYGYFQSEQYFIKYKDQIRSEMKVKTPVTENEKKILDEISSCNAVGVSMRLGDDYLNSPSLNVCNEDYYYKAMDRMYNENKDVVFYIFSDNINRAKKNFNFKYKVRYIEGFKDYESLRLLYSCNHFIISNSSFSWWGAYLSDNQDKVIISPNKWYNFMKEKPDIYYEGMTLLEV
ncbi:alpha-1,2-fucosyltransferase [Allobacillus sp. SKP2-8]|uniref:alpha-1,2-fucosyltransferase n=1 Tax=unclassified Allobacillus TaxID=2628859 RepID=UPI00118346D9|nr:alpha-1,2-fucosyltransferase [Allobacillus sp. SKP2-8]TSJ62546.1 alpha-1,2-fucosyltransferase [Allobacillus sp. SKP2-8]